MNPNPHLFSTIESSSSLAKALNINNINALYCTDVIKPVVPCDAVDCCYPALMRNGQAGRAAGPRCAFHQQTWFPKPPERGNLLLGQEFLRPEDSRTSGRKTCMCLNKTCMGIGYSALYFPVPRLKVVRDNVLKALCQGLHSTSDQWKITRDGLLNLESCLVLAPW